MGNMRKERVQPVVRAAKSSGSGLPWLGQNGGDEPGVFGPLGYWDPLGLATDATEEIGKICPSLETPNFLFDIGKGQYVTPFDQKLSRENWYQANREKQAPRKLGDWLPSSYEIGNEMVQEYDLQKPTYATIPIIRSTFYRVGNLKANSGWAALPGTAH